MEIIQIVMIGLCATVFIAVLDKHKEFGILISIMVGIIIFYIFFDQLKVMIHLLDKINGLMDVDDIYMKVLLQILGIAFISEFGAQLCRDSGQKSIANNIEIAGKMIILVLCAPILIAIINLIESIM